MPISALTCDDKPGQILRISIENGSPTDVYLQVQPQSFLGAEFTTETIDNSPTWWSAISGLTARKYFDGRYSGQAAGPIAAWTDIVGGTGAVQVLVGQNPTLFSAGFAADYGQYVGFLPASGSTPKLLQCNSLATSLTVPYTLVSIVRHGIVDGNVKNMVAMSSGGGLQWYTQGGASIAWIQNSIGGTATFSNAGANPNTTRTSLHALVVDGANSYLWDNGIKQVGDLTLSGTYAPTVGYIGAYSTSQNGFVGDMRSLIGFTGAATQSQLDSAFRGLCGQVPLKVVCEGDSLTAGVGGTPYPTQLAVALKDYSWVENHGFGGDTLTAMIANFATDILPEITATIRTNVVIWGGTNDIYFGADGPTTLARLWELADLCRKNGARVTLCSMIPRANFDATQESSRTYYNNGLAQGWRAHADGVVYLHKITGLSVFNPTFWDPDNVHLTSDGYSLVAQSVSEVCRKLGRFV